MRSNILSFGFQINIIKYDDEKVYEYKPNKDIAEEFMMCDLFIPSPYLRQHTKMINKQQFLFKFETDILLSSLHSQDENRLKMIARQLLEAIWTLHQHNLPGRCFNINNILWNERTEKITLMEFGLSSPLIIYPPELLNKKYRCYGIEIDQFLIGCILYQIYFRKPLELKENCLDTCFRNLNMELSKIPSQFIKDLMIGLLQFNLSKRIQFKDLAKLIGSHQDIQQFYSSIRIYKPKQNIIDQKIFFRESRENQNPTYVLTETALMESLIFTSHQSLESLQQTTQESFRQSNKIIIMEDTLMKCQLKLEQSKFQSFNDVMSILKDYSQDGAPELSLTILALNFGKIYFYLHLIKELEDENSSYFYKNEVEMNLWKLYRQQNWKTISEDIQKLKITVNHIKVSFNRDNEIKCVQQQVLQSQSDNQDFLEQQLFKIQFFNNSLSYSDHINKFLDGYRTQCLDILISINQNIEFTMNIQTTQRIRQSLILCAFADVLFKPQLECHKKIMEILKVKEISQYEQFNEYIKIDPFGFNEWFQQAIIYLKNHEIGRKYISQLNQLL
ncbi:unnamed protein product [Paramecium pentaurelia]|uniref:Protein kinase domain-containing protein n=1 Tax=Paramecium pentaurelia TaxID=43138 RepID=A0A8S1XN00_9CILI|nr:unnamed protein product [Paramecium pentaurelia]